MEAIPARRKAVRRRTCRTYPAVQIRRLLDFDTAVWPKLLLSVISALKPLYLEWNRNEVDLGTCREVL